MLLLALLAGCDNTVGLTIDAAGIARIDADAVFYVRVWREGEVVMDEHIDLAVETRLEAPDALDVRYLYGFAAYADLNGDALCEPAPDDLPWEFAYQPGYEGDFVWVPDPAESPDMGTACWWFDTPEVEDTDAPL